MQPIKILVIGDVHICDHPPGKRVDGYKDHILAKLYECVSIAEDQKATHILFLGDIFHVKVANRVSHRLVQDVGNVFTAFNKPVMVLVGNHDISDGTLDTLEKQPLGTLEFIPNVTLLKEDKFSVTDDLNIHPISGVTGISVDDFSIKKDNKNDIMVVHQSIVPDIKKEREILHDHLFDAAAIAEMTDIDIILYGHQHRKDGIYKIERENSTTCTFSNLGSICRLTVTNDDVSKEPCVLLLDIAGSGEVTMEEIMLKNVLPAHEAYFLDEHLDEKAHNQDIEDTIRKLKETEVSAFSIESVISDIEVRNDIDQGVKMTALNLLEEIR